MPSLFCGSMSGQISRRGYSSGLTPIHTGVFDSFLHIRGLAPYSQRHALANFWRLHQKNHTAFAWHERDVKGEQTIFLPGFLDQRQALELARNLFGPVIPSPIIFRFNQDYHEALLYD